MRRGPVTAVVGLVLLAGAAASAAAGVRTTTSTGGLLVDPVPVTSLVGGWLTLAVVLATAAVLCGIDAAARWRTLRRPAA